MWVLMIQLFFTGDNCKCEPESKDSRQIIPGNCLPDPLNFYKYTLKVEVKHNDVREKSICITLNPALDKSDRVRYWNQGKKINVY